MKQGRSLQEVLIELKRQNEAKKDYIAPSQALRLYPDGETFEISRMDDGERTDPETFGTTDLFHRQVGSALGIPAKYYEQMRKLKPELLADNVNAWFEDREQNYMIRSMDYGDGRVARALLSDRYRRIDNLEIANAVLPVFAGVEGMKIESTEITTEKLFIKVVDTRREAKCVNDVVQFGVVISNSEVGLGAVTVQPLVYTLKCMNGLIVNSMSNRKTHVGRAIRANEDSYTIYSDETIEADDRAFLLMLRDTVSASFDEAHQRSIISALEKAADMPITGRVQDVVELTGKTYDLSTVEQDGILNYLIQGGDLSLYGLSNAVTRASQDIESYDRATQMENLGWKIATMPTVQWREINA